MIVRVTGCWEGDIEVNSVSEAQIIVEELLKDIDALQVPYYFNLTTINCLGVLG